MRYPFITSVPTAPQDRDARSDLKVFRRFARPVIWKTLRNLVVSADLHALAARLGYRPVGNNQGGTINQDEGLTLWRSTFQNRPCFAIERDGQLHVFAGEPYPASAHFRPDGKPQFCRVCGSGYNLIRRLKEAKPGRVTHQTICKTCNVDVLRLHRHTPKGRAAQDARNRDYKKRLKKAERARARREENPQKPDPRLVPTAKAVQEARKTAGLTTAAMSRILGMSYKCILFRERGITPLTPWDLDTLEPHIGPIKRTASWYAFWADIQADEYAYRRRAAVLKNAPIGPVLPPEKKKGTSNV